MMLQQMLQLYLYDRLHQDHVIAPERTLNDDIQENGCLLVTHRPVRHEANENATSEKKSSRIRLERGGVQSNEQRLQPLPDFV